MDQKNQLSSLKKKEITIEKEGIQLLVTLCLVMLLHVQLKKDVMQDMV